ncbi:MAG TPA: ABC transporter substrate-binding protein, partial [Acidimicrobiales bacterium]|nr:ABC transporter substrate-binding protein [Acidimicrobiales bacterium]
MQAGVRVVGSKSTAGQGHGPQAWLAALAATAVIVAGCGLRVGGQQVHAATQAALGTGQGTFGPGTAQSGTSPGLSDTSSGASPTGISGATSAAGPTGATGGVLAPASGGNQVAPPLPAGGNGGATDVGVVGDTISVGNVSDLGGPVPGLFQGGPYGTQAYFDYVNSQGGVYGRKLKLVTADDQLTCSQNEADYQNLVGQVFAFVGGWSLDDNCGAQILAQHPDIPVLNQALSVQAESLPNAYNEAPYGAGAPLGWFQYYKQKFPDAVGAVGTIVGNQPAAVQGWKYSKATMESIGYKVIYEDDFPPAQSNFTADVIRMRSAGVKMVYIVSVNAPDLAAFSQEAAQQGWHPEVFASAIGYFGGYVSESGGAQNVENQYVNIGQAMFLGEDASTVPEVALFSHWINTAFPSFPVDQFSATSWANAALFVQALKAAGPHLTRKAVLDALRQIHTFNDN